MFPLNRRHWGALCAALTLFGVAQAQNFPTKPVRIVIPFAPGGSTDANARIIQDKLSTLWGQPVIIDAKPGANTLIGTDLVAKAAGDGHTLLLTSTAMVVNPSMYAKLPYDTLSDLVPITIVSVSPFALVTPVDSPLKSLRDALTALRSPSNKLSFGVSDSSAMLSGHLLNMLAKTDMQPISYKGAGPLMIDLAGGHVPLGIAAVSSVQGQVRGGRVRILGVGSLQPSSLFPQAPAIATELPGYEAISWFGLLAPKGTPTDVVQKIHRDVAQVLKDPEVVQKIAALGADPGGMPPAEFQNRIRREIELWGQVAKVAKIQPE
ncbi:MAG: tripartite tricarboxylate transporter substrate binding protein [Alphaproteobacteria bacterium]|nr:tripartite tricarboxylate transporter substrate binding protein [Alphaproteobacteria bacterium]